MTMMPAPPRPPAKPPPGGTAGMPYICEIDGIPSYVGIYLAVLAFFLLVAAPVFGLGFVAGILYR